jgi:hypothetical protein
MPSPILIGSSAAAAPAIIKNSAAAAAAHFTRFRFCNWDSQGIKAHSLSACGLPPAARIRSIALHKSANLATDSGAGTGRQKV